MRALMYFRLRGGVRRDFITAMAKTTVKEKEVKESRATIKNILSHSSDLRDRLVADLAELDHIVKDLKRMGYRIVLAQGVYDMVHEGHARFLEKARSFGDILIVGVDSDALTRARKGPDRPIVPQKERLLMLSYLRPVDILVLRELEHGLGKLIRVVKPHVLVTSRSTKDFNKDEQFGVYKKYVEQIEILEPQSATSTTARVRELTISGADQLAKEIMQQVPQLVQNALDALYKK